MRYEVFTLGKHFLQVHTSKGFTLFANAKLNPNGEVVSWSDKLIRRGGTWVIDTWKFLTIKYFPENPIYCAVFGFEDDDDEVKVNATDIDVDSISGVNGQLVDIGNISLPLGQSLPVNVYGGLECQDYKLHFEYDNELGYVCTNFPSDFGHGVFSVLESYGCFNSSVYVDNTSYGFFLDLHRMNGVEVINGGTPVTIQPRQLLIYYEPNSKKVLLNLKFNETPIDKFMLNIREVQTTGQIYVCMKDFKIYRFIV